MSTPDTPPPAGDDRGRELSGIQRAGIVLGAIAVLLIVFVVARSSGGGGSPASDTATRATTTATDQASTPATTGTTGDSGTTGTTTDGSASETGSTPTQTQPAPPRVSTVRVVNGIPQGGVETFRYRKGDRIVLKVQSDVADEIHVHGYDLKKDVTAGGTDQFSFTATIEGRFEVELEHAATQIAQLEVVPS
jgi:hypothetical protein